MPSVQEQHPLLICTEEDKEEIKRLLEIKDARLHEDIEAILDWFNKQPHLVEAGIDRDIVERMLIISKGSIEKTKHRIDNFYKYRALAPELIQNRENVLSDPSDLWSVYTQISIPRMYNGSRISVFAVHDPDPSNFSSEALFRNTFMLVDLRLKYDYFLNDIWLLDMKNTSFSHVLRLNPVVLQKTAQIFHDGTGLRVSAIHVINATNVFQHLVSFMKQFFNPKLMERLHVHDSLEELHKYIPKKYLPKDYGGEEISLSEFRNIYEKEIRSTNTKRVVIEASKMISNENRRPASNINEDYLAGSFRKLDFD
ncbi:alpha-tocopherol transfer protein [Bombyx mori]|uniref:CRAL-TRIO domain-containing protein n=1 Tax=Bombyx mori TaxID=7091 RepID=A0A8R2C7J7_BOMMO|nr:alpha-tocopherol transfer protein [Bombyx mori]XP_012548157.2 alpha-tocopherol transfer protein [Bombyx mori]